MIQRLLQGRVFYVACGLFVVLVYAFALTLRPVHPLEMAMPPDHDAALEWWPTGLDPAVVKHRVTREPFLAIAFLILSTFILGMGMGGLVLAGWGVRTGRLRSVWRFDAARPPPWSFGELGRILLVILFVAGLLPFVHLTLHAAVDPHQWLTVSMCFLDVLVILTIVTFTVGKGLSIGTAFGLSAARVSDSIRIGLRGYVAAFPWLFLVLFLVVEAARTFGLKPPVEPIQRLLFEEARPQVLALTILLACLIGPLAEELLFRGVLYTAIRRRASRLVAMVISGTLFALVHTNVVGFVPIMMLGCLLAYLYERSGSLISPLAVHVLHNTFLMALAMVVRYLLDTA